jgi:hypothetical protein
MDALYLRALVIASKNLRFASRRSPTDAQAETLRWLRHFIINVVCDDIENPPDTTREIPVRSQARLSGGRD